jgi:hypothetical protein
VRDTPQQVGKKQMSTSVEGFYFDKSYEEADIVAKVKILEWLGERNNEDELQKTIFRASLEKTFKNIIDSDLKEIKLLQDGNSEYTIENYPLFKNNDRLILYLKKATGEGNENTYWILGGNSGIFRIVNTDEQEYVVKQVGDCFQLSDAKATEDNDKIRKILNKNYTVEFPNLNKAFPETYKLDAMEKIIEKQKNK